GVVEKVHVAKGGKVSTGDLVVTLRSEAGAGDSAQPAAAGSASGGSPSAGSASATVDSAPGKSASATVDSAPGKPASATPGSGAAKPAAAGPAAGTASAAPAGAATDGAGQIRSDFPLINEAGFSRAHAGPSVRLLARELGVDLTKVK